MLNKAVGEKGATYKKTQHVDGHCHEVRFDWCVAKTFDDIMLIPTFVLTPLTYLGGVFYSVSMLSPIWHTLTHFNPIFYMVDAFRYAMIGRTDVNIFLSLGIICLILIVLTVLNLVLLKKSVGLREWRLGAIFLF